MITIIYFIPPLHPLRPAQEGRSYGLYPPRPPALWLLRGFKQQESPVDEMEEEGETQACLPFSLPRFHAMSPTAGVSLSHFPSPSVPAPTTWPLLPIPSATGVACWPLGASSSSLFLNSASVSSLFLNLFH